MKEFRFWQMDREALYLRLPVLLQHIACSLEGARIKKSRFGPSFQRLLRAAEVRASWGHMQIETYRDQRLRQFLLYCYRHVPYYRRMFKESGIMPEEVKNLNDLNNLPILTKDVVRTHFLDFMSETIAEKDRIILHTSGTTGAGLRFPASVAAIQEQWAVWWRYRRWHGLQMDTWCAYFGGRSVVPLSQARSPFWRYNLPGRQILFSGYHMSPRNLDVYLEEIRKKRPPWLHGYPSLLALLAAHAVERRFDLGYKVSWITVGAENLMPSQATIIERAFGVRPRQHYGMAEGVANISECPKGNLHVDEDFSAVEFVPTGDGQYRIIGTNFTNPAFPLLRYDTGDIAKISLAQCNCGLPGRIIERIDGRMEDYIVLKNGARIGRLDHVFKDLVNIREAQIYQKSMNEIVLKVVKGKDYIKQDEITLLAEFRKRVGNDIKISIDYVDQIERNKSGKLRFVISEIKEAKIGSHSNP